MMKEKDTFCKKQAKPLIRSNHFQENHDPIDPSEIHHEILPTFTSHNGPTLSAASVLINEFVISLDPRSKEKRFYEAKRKELKCPIARKTWKRVLRHEMHPNDYKVGGRFFLAIKDKGIQKEVWKARFVVQGWD